MSSRLALAGASGALPTEGSVMLVGAASGLDLGPFGDARVTMLQDMMPDAANWAARGHQVVRHIPDERFDAAVVFLPRSRQAARDRVARATAVARRVFVDGQKTDGVETMLKDVRRAVPLQGTLSKAHGKLFWFDTEGMGGAPFETWLAEPGMIDDRWHVVPGVFSADGIDPGSALLAQSLPAHLSGRIADLGAGWGYLSACALERCEGISELHLVEAQASALDCARRNVSDARARFHWADATDWTGCARSRRGGHEPALSHRPHGRYRARPGLHRRCGTASAAGRGTVDGREPAPGL